MISVRDVTRVAYLLALVTAFCVPRAAMGGSIITWTNGHSYQAVFADNPTWFQAGDAAAALTLNGSPGYLATFTTRTEQEYVIGQLGGGAALNAFWLGGYQDTLDPNYLEPDGGWKWITGEPWLGVALNDPVLPRYDAINNNAYLDGVHSEEYTITWWRTGGINDYYHSPRADLSDNWGGPARGFIVEFNTVPEPATLSLLALGGLLALRRRR